MTLKRMQPIWKAFAVAVVAVALALVAFIALVQANAARDRSQHAANDAKQAAARAQSVAQCVNNVLADRNRPTRNDAAAHISFAQADKAFKDALLRVLLAPKTKQAGLYKSFIVTFRASDATDTQVVKTLLADQIARDNKPLGKC